VNTRRDSWVIAGAAAIAVLLTYSSILGNGLIWDDYHALRRRDWVELAGVWHGTWDPAGYWPVFYRPLSIWYYALNSALFGAHALPLHALSIVGLIAAAWLLGLFVARETDRPRAGMVAAALLAVHPGIAHAAGPFFFLQNHLLAVIVVCAGLVAWQRCRSRMDVRAWWPVAALATVGFLIKEDTVMILPLALAAQVIRAKVARDVAYPSRALLASAAALLGGLFLWRYLALGEIGGLHETLSAEEIARNIFRGPFRTMVEFRGWFFENGSEQTWASVVSVVVIAVGSVLAMTRGDAGVRVLWTLGVVTVVCFALPLATMSNMWRYHLVTVGVILMLAAACRRLPPFVAWLLVGFLCLASRATIAPFSPCGDGTLAADAELLEMPHSPELKEWLREKAAACQAGGYSSFSRPVPVP
jgi:hypothetical protein